jgi:hypothetical protein
MNTITNRYLRQLLSRLQVLDPTASFDWWVYNLVSMDSLAMTMMSGITLRLCQLSPICRGLGRDIDGEPLPFVTGLSLFWHEAMLNRALVNFEVSYAYHSPEHFRPKTAVGREPILSDMGQVD